MHMKYKLLVMVFLGMYIRVIGLLTTNVYVFFCVRSSAALDVDIALLCKKS